MKREVYLRAVEAARYIVREGATVRACAERFAVSKTTIHKDMRQRLPEIDPALAARVDAILRKNRAERHLRGGATTKARYAGAKKRASGSISRKSRSCTSPSGEPRP